MERWAMRGRAFEVCNEREFGSEVSIEPDEVNGLDSASSAQCQHIRSVSVGRIEQVRGNIGATSLAHIREVLSLILDID